MQIDPELYRREVRIGIQPAQHLSVIDINPERPQRTLVFLHGFAGRARQWYYQLRTFSDQNRVIAFDQRGHGQSDKPGSGYNMATLQSDLLAVLDTFGINQQIVLVGHSFGGAIAAGFAAKYPERVERLILIATAEVFNLTPLYRTVLRLPATTLHTLTPFTRNWLGAPPNVLKAWYDEALSLWSGWDVFVRVKTPTLVIRGHQDRVFKRPLFEEVARTIPGAEEIDVGASGHMVMLERHDAVNRTISRFLETPTRSWRETENPIGEQKRSSLLIDRPWLPYYDEGVPHTIAIPRVALPSLLDSAARRFPSKVALAFEANHIPYRRLVREVNRFANALVSLGVKKGDRVMLLLPNLPQMVIAFYGTLKAGGVAVFTLPTSEESELLRQVNEVEATVLVTLTQFDKLIYQLKQQLDRGGSSSLKHIIFTHVGDYLPSYKRVALGLSPQRRLLHLLDIPLDASMHVFNRLLYSQNQIAPEVVVAHDDLAAIIYTGGTTDVPKGVMLTHSNLVANTLQTRHWLPEAEEGNERFLSVLPFTHSYGLTTALNVPLSLGAMLILKASFDTTDVLNTIKKYQPTIFPGVPQMFVAIKDFPGVRKFGIESIKACISGAAPLPVEVQEAFEKLTRGRLVEGYGLTEASPVTHSNPLHGMRKVGSIGIPYPNTEAKVVDLRKGKRLLPAGHIGELVIRGPQVMVGYWNQPEETSKVLTSDGWLYTGDIAQMDNDSYFRIIARKADMWYPSREGEPAFPRDVEEVLYEIPQVREAAVVEIAGQPIAFVIAGKDRPTPDAVIAFCKRRLPPTLVPRLVIFVEEFPRSFIGKVLRRELARLFTQSEHNIPPESSATNN